MIEKLQDYTFAMYVERVVGLREYTLEELEYLKVVMLFLHDRGDHAMNQNLDTQSTHFSKVAFLIEPLKKSSKFLTHLYL